MKVYRINCYYMFTLEELAWLETSPPHRRNFLAVTKDVTSTARNRNVQHLCCTLLEVLTAVLLEIRVF